MNYLINSNRPLCLALYEYIARSKADNEGNNIMVYRVIKDGLKIGILTENNINDCIRKAYNLHKSYTGQEWLHAPFYTGNGGFALGGKLCYLEIEKL